MAGLLLGMVLSLLPKRYRERIPEIARADLRQGAIASGLVVCVVCLGLFIVRYLSFLQFRVVTLGERALSRGAEEVLTAPAVQYGMGYAAMVEYLFHPLTLILIYFTLEGAARLLATVVTAEVAGTLPLYLVAWVEGRFSQARAERALGPRVPDIVEPMYSPDYDLRIFTCRRQGNWDRMITVAWQGQFYEVLGEQPGKPPHHFIYRLRKSPPGRVVRAVHPYDLQEVMWARQRQPGLLSRLSDRAQQRLAEIRAQREPPVPDIVEAAEGQEYQLRIASRRPKPGWNHLITIEYRNELLEILGQGEGTSAYPYVYLLRKLPPGKIIRAITHYRPEDPLTCNSG